MSDFYVSSGKSAKNVKAKNSKGSKEPEEPSKSKSGYKNPRRNPLFEADSDDDNLGQEPPLISNCAEKFSDKLNLSVSKMIKTADLLAGQFATLCDDFNKLIVYSATKQTWARHSLAWKLYDEFCETFKIRNSLPISVEFARAFVMWAVTSRKLKDSTVKAYISSLNMANTLGNVRNTILNSDPCVKLVLKGAKNISGMEKLTKKDRLPMSMDLLTDLGHHINKVEWSEYSKQVVWTACLVSFLLSCRMGEMLSMSEKDFDPKTALIWGNVKMLDNSEILMYIP